MTDAWTRKRFPRFRAGEIVVLTREAIRANIKARGSIFGIVLPPGRFGRLSVRVRRIDQKRVGDYHVTFWRHTTPQERRRATR